jgi:hypothetical protein
MIYGKVKTTNYEARRGVRVVHGAALEKRSARKRSVGSNPTLSVPAEVLQDIPEYKT